MEIQRKVLILKMVKEYILMQQKQIKIQTNTYTKTKQRHTTVKTQIARHKIQE